MEEAGVRLGAEGRGWRAGQRRTGLQPQGGGDRAAPPSVPAPWLKAGTLPSKWILLLRWMSSSVLFMDCTLALHSCTSCGNHGGSPAAPQAPPAQPQAPTWRRGSLKTEAPLGTHRGSGEAPGSQTPPPCRAHLLEGIEGLGGHVFIFRALHCPLQDVLEGGACAAGQCGLSQAPCPALGAPRGCGDKGVSPLPSPQVPPPAS